MLIPLMFGFKGRIRRSEWWLSRLVLIIVVLAGLIILATAFKIIGETPASDTGLGIAIIACFPILLWMQAATCIKRFHDQDLTGWLILTLLIPGIGFFIGLIMLGCLDGTAGPNRFGPSAKYPSGPAAAVFE